MQAGCSLQVRPHISRPAHIASALITMSLSSFHSSQPFSHLPCCNSIPKRPLQLLSYHCTARLAKFPFWNCSVNNLDCHTFLQLVLVLVTVGAIYCIYKTQAAPTIKPKYWSANQPANRPTRNLQKARLRPAFLWTLWQDWFSKRRTFHSLLNRHICKMVNYHCSDAHKRTQL